MSEKFVDPMPGVPLVESPFFEQRLATDPAFENPEWKRIARDLHRVGFASFEFPADDFDAMAAEIIESLDGRYDWTDWQERDTSVRVMDAWEDVDAVRKIATNQYVLDLLQALYGRRPIPFQTLNFPVGTEQHFHSDSIHFSSFPERFMCGVWVPLEDIDDDNGPLVYYPGSHRLPIYTHEHLGTYAPAQQEIYEPVWAALVESLGLEPETFVTKKGQCLIWAANLLHGGAPHRDKSRTRHSQVSHYYFENCCYYMPHSSDPMRGVVKYKDVVNIATGKHEPNRFVLNDLDRKYIEQTAPKAGDLERLRNSPDFTTPVDFDGDLYLEMYPDVAATGMDPIYHFRRFGRWEGRPIKR